MTDDSTTALFMQGLNASQQEAVLKTEGNLLVLAGAGTGKTRVLTTRIAHILQTQKARPFEILSVTFTNKASQEMRERLHAMGFLSEGMWMGTFHSLCGRILRRFGDRLGFSSTFTILDTQDQNAFVKQLFKSECIDDKKHPIKLFIYIMSRWKDKGLTPAQITPKDDEEAFYLKIYRIYQERLLSLNALDFSDLLLMCLKLFQEHADVLLIYQEQFKYILVDEYQDTNACQYVWLRLLSLHHQNLCCVGDDDQSIYGWRGAEIENILRFQDDFTNASLIRLEDNYRSTSAILGAASSLIDKNTKRLGKTLLTTKTFGHKVFVRGLSNPEQEANYTVDEILKLASLYELSDMAILVRSSAQTRQYEESLVRSAVPYRVIGGVRFYERQEIKDSLSYARFLITGEDSFAFQRILNVPKRGMGPTTLQKINLLAQEEGIPLVRAARLYAQIKETTSHKKPLTTLFYHLDTHTERLKSGENVHDVVHSLLVDVGYFNMWLEDKTQNPQDRLDNIREMLKAILDYPDLESFLEHVSLVSDRYQSSEESSVTLMTLHGSKGLEFKVVFLGGWEEGLFPSQRSINDLGIKGLEEERRLAYVGMTRARERLFITYAMMRGYMGGYGRSMPSRFIKDIDPSFLEHKRGQRGI